MLSFQQHLIQEARKKKSVSEPYDRDWEHL